ncbi:hypothetical protein [Halalkalibacter akibai]|uniref:Uncharacterized protein n=1 Tax=Halalkalibacter akibai (strain ATCC 43226 / DSM 21942 / CIP 109018 / JCM 9157 / 1139) TaxID=1236973 RepID=W4QWT6_HALA3|nr:hypothetical protein [Halalkalibacter akibai]GAE36367.1 hypothetical protein JCM9157_3544 [Halalkalibacter akibai JCM 9157]
MNRDFTLQQIADGLTKTVLNASDKDLEGFQRILEETLKVREAHKDLHKLVQSYTNSSIQRS